MRSILETILSWTTSALIGIYIELYVLKEDDFLRFLCGEILFAVFFFIVIMMLFEVAKTRDLRKKKIEQRKKERRKMNEKISQGTERA